SALASKKLNVTSALSRALRRMASRMGLLRQAAYAMTAIGVIGGASAFGGNHGRPEGMFRRAFLAEGRTIMGLLDSLEYEAADAQRRFLRPDLFNFEEAFGVMFAKFIAQLVAALGDRTDPAPFAVAYIEDLIDQPLRRQVALTRDDAAVLVLDSCRA